MLTKNLWYLYAPKRGEELRERRLAIDCCREKPLLKYTLPYTAKIIKCMGKLRTTIFGVEDLRKLNCELMLSSHQRSSGCQIYELNRLDKAPSIFFTDGWRILKFLVIKCQRDDVVASVHLFFFFYSRRTNNCFISLHRRSNRPQVLLNVVCNPKDWKKFVFIEEVGPSRPWWV